MRVCLIGKNLTNFVLAKNLSNKNLYVDIIFEEKKKRSFSQRTIGISNDNFNFLTNINNQPKIKAWPIKKIKIYSDKHNSKELFEFKSKKVDNFFMLKHSYMLSYFENACKKSKYIKFKKVNYKKKKFF